MSEQANRIEEARRQYGTSREIAARRYLESQIEQARKK